MCVPCVSSSSNPWVLAELQQALLQHPAAERQESSEEHSEERSEESSDEVIVVRVALPSAAERRNVRELDTKHTPSINPGDSSFDCRRPACGLSICVFAVKKVQAPRLFLPSLTARNEAPVVLTRIIFRGCYPVVSVADFCLSFWCCFCFGWRFLRHLHQSVLAVARDVGVDDRLSAVDVSMLEDLTGGRRAELVNVLERLKRTSPGGISIGSLTAPRAECSCSN